ncbi:MAG: aminotransferase class V-fold PLP-dependent enzyme [Proteobacteria bacterium]|nr:aminotransferase class V-fold PLP-dependent enzyme [Pseudomonadota bacterium]
MHGAALRRREFIEQAAAGVLLGVASRARVAKANERVRGADARRLARDETYWREIRQAFSVSRSVINLNNAGVCPCPRIVTNAVVDHIWEQEKVPPHTAFTTRGPRMEVVRAKLARLFGCGAEEIAITRNATESLQIVLLGVPLARGDEVLTTTHEYWAMLNALEQRRRRDGIRVKKVDVPVPPRSPGALVRLFERGLTDRTKLILVSHPVNLTGQLFPVKRICELAHARGIEVIVDGAQSFGQLDYKQADLGCDYFGTSLHKWLMAPKGTGMLFVRRNKIEKTWPLLPASPDLIDNVRKFEAIGTAPATPLAIGEAIAFHNGIGAKRKEERLRYLTHYWAKRLRALSGVRLHTSLDPRMSCAIATLQIRELPPAAIVEHLWQKHRILTANVSKRVPALKGVRVSPSLHNTIEELDHFCNVMEGIARRGLPAAG